MTHALYDVPIKTIDGKETTLRPYQGQVLLVVNVASLCGFTPQYAELETLYQDYQSRGFSVLGFPCDQFLHQEPGTNQEIKNHAQQCYRITFPLFAKIDVNGKQCAPLYEYIHKHIEKRPIKLIPWNFTKVLIDTQGTVLRRYLPTTSFKTIRKAIDLCYT